MKTPWPLRLCRVLTIMMYAGTTAPRPVLCSQEIVAPAPCKYRSWQQRCQSVDQSSECSISEISDYGESDVSEYVTRSGRQTQRFYPYRVKFRHITRTHVIRTPKTSHCQWIDNSRARQMRTTPHVILSSRVVSARLRKSSSSEPDLGLTAGYGVDLCSSDGRGEDSSESSVPIIRLS